MQQAATKPLGYKEFLSEKQQGALILDTRDQLDEGLINGAQNISFSSAQFSTWVGILIKPDQRLVLITEVGQEEQVVTKLAEIGYLNIAGYLQGGFEVYSKEGGQFKKATIVPVKDFIIQDSDKDKHIYIDVRKPGEWAEGIMPNALCITLEELDSKINLIPKDKILHVYCKMGPRSRMGASILNNHGFEGLVITESGGSDALAKEENVSLVPYK